MIYGYVRVSTEEQNLKNQKVAISEQFNVDEWVFEKRSGTIDYHKRNLGGLMDKLQKGDTLVVTEISRLGRSLSMVFKIINKLHERGIRIVAIKNNFDMKATENDITSQVLMFAFALSAQIERDLISERTKQGLVVAKSKGKRIGRQKGETVYHVKLRPYQSEIEKKLKKGQSLNSLAKEYNVRWSTMKKFVEVYSKMEKPKPLTERPRKHGHPTYAELEWFETHENE